MELSLNQCRQIAANADVFFDLRDVVAALQDQPEWLTAMGEIDDLATVQAVLQGGCASGAYMPAVTYYTASQTMGSHGTAITEYIEEQIGETPTMGSDDSWDSYQCTLCSYAVELWCSRFADVLDGVDWD